MVVVLQLNVITALETIFQGQKAPNPLSAGLATQTPLKKLRRI